MKDYLEERVLFAALSVRRTLPAPQTWSVWREALQGALDVRGLRYERDVPVRVPDRALESDIMLDLIVEGRLVVELKNLPHLEPIHDQQMGCFLSLSGLSRGMVINFGQAEPRKGIRGYRVERSGGGLPGSRVVLGRRTSC